MSKSAPPQQNELELSLLGPGYGECVVVYLGGGSWIVVDSCIAPRSSRSAALEYLENLGVDPATAVKAIVASHWHDDHTRGLAGLVRACSNATIVCTEAVKTGDFVTLACGAGRRAMMSTSGINEFAEVLDVLIDRKKASLPDVCWATANKTLLRIPAAGNLPEGVLTSLSPSDAALTRSKLEIAKLLPKAPSEKRRVGELKTNNASVVLLIQIGEESLLLGSDLESTADTNDGWTAVINSTARPVARSAAYKVAHHGSDTAEDPRIWPDLVADPRWVVLTPFVRGRVALPTKLDAKRICEQTPHAFATSSPRRGKRRRRHPAVERTLKEAVRSIKLSQPAMGQIRLRKTLGADAGWRVELFDAAVCLAELTA